jgi:hypothetical protein
VQKDAVVDGFGRRIVAGTDMAKILRQAFWNCVEMRYHSFEDPLEKFDRGGYCVTP